MGHALKFGDVTWRPMSAETRPSARKLWREMPLPRRRLDAYEVGVVGTNVVMLRVADEQAPLLEEKDAEAASTCETCSGTGKEECDNCYGDGERECDLGHHHECDECGGDGYFAWGDCGGDGK